MAGPFGLGFVGGLAGGVVTSTFGDLLTPPRRALHQSINRSFPNELPDAGSIIEAYQKGLLSERMLRFGCNSNGVCLPEPNNDQYSQHFELWNATAAAKKSVPSGDAVMDAMVRGLITPETAGVLMTRSNSEMLPYKILHRYYYKYIDESKLFTALNRNLITQDSFKIGLERLGLSHDGIPDIYDALRQNIPNTGEISQLASRGMFDIAARINDGLFDEFPDDMEKLYVANGFGDIRSALPNTQLDVLGATWAKLAWANHWSTIGIGPLMEMFQRFRHGRGAKFAADGLAVPDFNVDTTRNWFARNAIPPQMRDSLIAAGYRPLDRRVLLIGATTGEIQRPEAIEILKDSGLCSVDAERFADVIDARVEYQNNAPIRAIEHGLIGRAFRAAVKSYEVGVFDRNKFTDQVSALGVSTQAADGYADVIDSENLINAVTAVVTQLKRGYLNGAIDPFELPSMLSQAGIAPVRQQTYLVEWGALRTLERRTANTEKIMSWLVQGIMSVDVAYLRLKNLGWIDVDALAYIVEASLKIAKRDAAIEQAGFRNAKANAAQLLRLQKQAETQVRQMRAELRRLLPVGRLIKWYRQGSISEVYFENALRAQDYPDNIIAEYFLEAKKDGPLPAQKQRNTSKSTGTGSASTIGGASSATGTAAGSIEQNPPGTEPTTPSGPTNA